MKRRLLITFFILMIVNVCNKPTVVVAGQEDEIDIQQILGLIEEPEPIEEILKDNVRIKYCYDESKHRTKKVFLEREVSYLYEGNLLVSESGENDIQYFYSNVNGDMLCTELIINGGRYTLLYDEIGNVEYICDENNLLICKYEYVGASPKVYENVDGEFVLNVREDFIGNINPIRYQAWYYDRESKHYYMGKGIYYDVENNLYVNNQYKVKNARSSEPAIIRTIVQAYSYYMSSPTYGVTDFANDCVTRSEWNNGKRWYDGLNQTELVARCIFAENNGRKEDSGNNGYYDRVAITVVIINRVNSDMDISPYGAVTRNSQFSTINPGSYDKYLSDTKDARLVKDKTNSAWQEATLLACTLAYTTSLDELKYIRTIPSYISTQTFFLSVNYVYDNKAFSVFNNSWYYGGSPIRKVALAGVAELQPSEDIRTLLAPYYIKGYNIFFEYY